MNNESIITAIFFAVLIIVLYRLRKKLVIQKVFFPVLYIFLYRTKWGLKRMDTWAKGYPRLFNFLGISGIYVGWVGMVFIAFTLAQSFFKLFADPSAASGVALVLPVQVKGAVYVPILYWLISIMIIAVVHEFAHGVIARRYGVKVKSSGFAFVCLLIPMIPAAFVEPDDKQLAKKKTREQLAVFAAGPYSNILLAAVCIMIIAWGFAPMTNAIVHFDGVILNEITPDMPAMGAGMQTGEKLIGIDEAEILNITAFIDNLADRKPGDTIAITTQDAADAEQDYMVTLGEHPQNASRGYLGVKVEQSRTIAPPIKEKYGEHLPEFVLWLSGLFSWLFILNLGIGLFNLVPLGPLDGGRMIMAVLLDKFEKEKAMKIFKYISMVFLALIVIPLLASFFK